MLSQTLKDSTDPPQVLGLIQQSRHRAPKIKVPPRWRCESANAGEKHRKG